MYTDNFPLLLLVLGGSFLGSGRWQKNICATLVEAMRHCGGDRIPSEGGQKAPPPPSLNLWPSATLPRFAHGPWPCLSRAAGRKTFGRIKHIVHNFQGLTVGPNFGICGGLEIRPVELSPQGLRRKVFRAGRRGTSSSSWNFSNQKNIGQDQPRSLRWGAIRPPAASVSKPSPGKTDTRPQRSVICCWAASWPQGGGRPHRFTPKRSRLGSFLHILSKYLQKKTAGNVHPFGCTK